jgi:hypothetical protein
MFGPAQMRPNRKIDIFGSDQAGATSMRQST